MRRWGKAVRVKRQVQYRVAAASSPLSNRWLLNSKAEFRCNLSRVHKLLCATVSRSICVQAYIVHQHEVHIQDMEGVCSAISYTADIYEHPSDLAKDVLAIAMMRLMVSMESFWLAFFFSRPISLLDDFWRTGLHLARRPTLHFTAFFHVALLRHIGCT